MADGRGHVQQQFPPAKSRLMAAGKGAVKRDILAMEEEGRLAALKAEIDTRLLAQKAREAGLERDPTYLRRVGEYRKTRLINLHRERLVADMEPDDEALKAYYEENRSRFVLPETRKVQMVVLETEEEAKTVKQQIESGEMTIYQAALEHSSSSSGNPVASLTQPISPRFCFAPGSME